MNTGRSSSLGCLVFCVLTVAGSAGWAFAQDGPDRKVVQRVVGVAASARSAPVEVRTTLLRQAASGRSSYRPRQECDSKKCPRRDFYPTMVLARKETSAGPARHIGRVVGKVDLSPGSNVKWAQWRLDSQGCIGSSKAKLEYSDAEAHWTETFRKGKAHWTRPVQAGDYVRVRDVGKCVFSVGAAKYMTLGSAVPEMVFSNSGPSVPKSTTERALVDHTVLLDFLYVHDPERFRRCNGIMLSGDVVLTARHCVDPNVVQLDSGDGLHPVVAVRGNRRNWTPRPILEEFLIQGVPYERLDLALLKTEDLGDGLHGTGAPPAWSKARSRGDERLMLTSFWPPKSEMRVGRDPVYCRISSTEEGWALGRFRHRCDVVATQSGAPVFLKSNGLLAGITTSECCKAGGYNSGFHIEAIAKLVTTCCASHQDDLSSACELVPSWANSYKQGGWQCVRGSQMTRTAVGRSE